MLIKHIKKRMRKKKILYVVFTINFLFVNNLKAQVSGCTDAFATNYNSSATINDGSCIYSPASVTPTSTFNLGSSLKETSGLIQWNNQIWTHNDNTDVNIYGLDTINGNLVQSFPLNSITNIDWEDISQDNKYVYIGDFGNNFNGDRTDLKIYRVDKNSILANSPIIDTIKGV